MQRESANDESTHFSSEKRHNGPEVWFIRHGESEAHAGRPALHTRDVSLTEAGRQQAEKIAQTLGRKPTVIVSSPYRRAHETAQPTCQRFPDVRVEIWPVEEFTYLGSLAGVLSTKYERMSRVNAYWESCDPHYKDGDAESFAQFLARVRATINRLKGMEGLIAVFTHEQFIRAAQGLLDGSMGEMPHQMARFRQLLLTSPLPYGCVETLDVCPRQAYPVSIFPLRESVARYAPLWSMRDRADYLAHFVPG